MEKGVIQFRLQRGGAYPRWYTQPLHLKGECSSKRWRKHTDTQKTTMCRGRRRSDMAASQGTPGAARSWKRQEGPALTPLQGAWPCWPLISDFRSQNSKRTRYTSAVVSHYTCGHLSPPAGESNTRLHVSEMDKESDLVMPILQQTGRAGTGGQSSCVVAVLS